MKIDAIINIVKERGLVKNTDGSLPEIVNAWIRFFSIIVPSIIQRIKGERGRENHLNKYPSAPKNIVTNIAKILLSTA